MNENFKPVVIALAGVFATFTAVHAADAIKIDKVEVVSQTPLPSSAVSINELSSTVQTVNANDIKNSQSLDISSFINENLNGVFVNNLSGNPLQMDVNYHGLQRHQPWYAARNVSLHGWCPYESAIW